MHRAPARLGQRQRADHEAERREATGYQRPANTLPVAATIVKATAGRSPPNQPLPKFCGNDSAV